MKKSNRTGKIGPKILKPTEKEIVKTIEKVKDKYGVAISRDEAIRFARLTQELGWWLMVEKEYDSQTCITGDMVKEVKVHVEKNSGRSITLKEAHDKTKKSLILTTNSEKERIANELRSIIAAYRSSK